MSINSLIISTLSPLNIPVKLLNYSGNETTYITFFEFNQMAHINADDEEQSTRYSIQIDIFSEGNYMNIVKQTKDLLKSVGFIRTSEAEEYDPSSGRYHKVIRLRYISDNTL